LLGVSDFETGVTGFDMTEIDMIIGDAETAGEEPEDLTPATEKAVTRRGDLWLLGDHRLLCADAREEESFKTLLVDQF
jgi:hypothetical protein